MSAGLLGFLETRGLVADATSALCALGEQLHACPSDQLGDLLGELSGLVRQAEAVRVAVTREAMSRGVVASSDAACPADWVADNSGPATQSRDALALARVAATAALPGYETVDEAVRGGRIPVGIADAVVREFAKLRIAVPPTMHQDVLSGLVTLAEDGHSPAQLGRFRDRLIGQYGADGALDRRHERLRARRGMSGFGQDLDGMFHAVLCLDPESHAVIAPVIEALSAPVTGSIPSGGGPGTVGVASDDPVRDERSADQRRLDALVEVCAVYQGLGPRTRLGVSTRLVITMPLADLVSATGCGLTQHGDVISPAAVRALACDAGVIPMVLGSQSEPLDVGRESRLATPAQLAALWQRDKGCSFPGCSRPPGFCQAHHVSHWLAHLGPTELENLALLCRRHHTIVHQRGYTATIGATGVTWHTGARGRPSPPPATELTP